MKKFRTIVSLVLAVILLQNMCAVPVTAYQIDTQSSQVQTQYLDSQANYGNFSYSTSTNSVTISKYNGTETEVTIPGEIDGKPVGAIYIRAFEDCTTIKTINIPDTLRTIFENAFDGCKNLTTINIYSPNNITPIKSSIKSIRSGAFLNCTNLKKITIPDEVTRIEPFTFSHTGLTEVNIPDGVTIIRQQAFHYCNDLKCVTIPKSVISIEDKAFGYGIEFIPNVSAIEFKVPGFTIYGYSGSAAETYAIENGFTFINQGNSNPNPVPENKIELTTQNTEIDFVEGKTFYYDTLKKEPKVTVTYNGELLTNDKDYCVDYDNNVLPSGYTSSNENSTVNSPQVRITGKGKYKGTVSAPFTIYKKSVGTCHITLDTTMFIYDGQPKKPKITVEYFAGEENICLIQDMDYTVSYSNNTQPGVATVTITGTGKGKDKGSYTYTGQVTQKFFIYKKNTSIAGLDFNTDVFAFDNSSSNYPSGKTYGQILKDNQYTITVDGKSIKTNDYNKLQENLTHTKFAQAEDDLLNESWGGCCYGMSCLVFLAKEGLVPVEKYNNATNLHKLKKPINDKTIASAIVYHQLLWCKFRKKNKYRLDTNSVDKILELLSEKTTSKGSKRVVFAIEWYTDTGATGVADIKATESDNEHRHAMLAYGYEKLEKKKIINGKKYDNRILVYDPNYVNFHGDSCIYFYFNSNTEQFEWIIPEYQSDAGKPTPEIYYYDNDIDVINSGRYFDEENVSRKTNVNISSKTTPNLNENSYISRLDTFAIDDDYSISKLKKTVNGYKDKYRYSVVGDKSTYVYCDDDNTYGTMSVKKKENTVMNVSSKTMSDGQLCSAVTPTEPDASITPVLPIQPVIKNDIIKCDSNDFFESISGYNLLDSDVSYKVTQSGDTPLNLRMDYEDCLLKGSSEKGKSVLFDKDGFVQVEGNHSDFHLQMTFNDNYPTDWFTVKVDGKNADCSSLRMTKEGYILSSDNLKDVTVKLNDKKTCVTSTFSTDYDSVLLYEINQNTVGIKVDTDNNGTYETELFDVISLTTNAYNDEPLTMTLDTEYTHCLDNSATDNTEKTWYSEDDSIATVDQYGNVTGISAGKTKVVCVALDGSIQYECEVVVNGEYLVGDADNNGIINMRDCIIMQRALLEMVNLSQQTKLSADIDSNGNITLTDVVMVMKYLLGYQNIHNVGTTQRTNFAISNEVSTE